ncbi:MAG: gamma-glutamyltransferase family protein [Bacteroidota bacterium]
MGWIATSERQAAAVGAEVLQAGGTACDAAIAVAAALTVTEPTSNGLGGDLFATVHDGREVHALAANGASPRGLPVEAIRADHTRMPLYGWPTVTVPGQVSGWGALHQRFGRVPFAELMAPAAALAREGFVVGPVTAAAWARAARVFDHAPSWKATFLVDGVAPAAGDRFVASGHATTLQALADDGPEAFYGALAEEIVAFSTETGGCLALEDFTAHRARFVTPLAVDFAGWRVFGMTAPTQGVCALEALGLLGRPDPGQAVDVHRAIEAIKLAFADTTATVADPGALRTRPEALLEAAYLATRRQGLTERAGPSPAPPGIDGGTVLLCTADDEGTVASVIQSNFHGFGSGLVVPELGIALQNRGAGFTLERAHPNAIGAGKQPFHTILPGLVLTPEGASPFGCMGGQMQPQGHVQLVTALARGTAPQAAVDAPRWRWLEDGRIALERGFPVDVAEDLAARGHRLQRDVDPVHFGGAQILWRDGEGFVGGSDPRKDGGVVRTDP